MYRMMPSYRDELNGSKAQGAAVKRCIDYSWLMPGHRVLLLSTDSKTRRKQAAAPEHKSQGMDRVEQSEAVQITVFGGPLSHRERFLWS
jgi:hypothetical protein